MNWSALALFALVGLALADVSAAAPTVTLAAPATLEPGQRLSASVAIKSDDAAPTTWRIAYSLQSESAMYTLPPPDPVFGTDRARGARSWTVVEGKTIETGSLTDGKDYTDAGTDWKNEGFTEAFQYVDLGRALNVARMTYLSGDANHSWKLDVAVSADGEVYTPAPGLQDFDTYQRWGEVALPLAQPVSARFIRLRYHKGGEKTPVFRFPCSLSVFSGVDGEKWELPQVGELVGQGTANLDIAAQAEGSAAIRVDKPLGPGLYLLAARLECGPFRQIVYRHVMVLPRPLKQVTPESRVGINAANGDWAPVLRELGVGWVRFENLKWPFFSPEPGVYDFTGTVKPWVVNADTIFKGYRDAGISILPFLFMTAPYASSAPADVAEGRRPFYPPKSPSDFAEFAYQAAARYATKANPPGNLKTTDGKTGLGYVRHYEIWNEPNLTDPGWGPWVGTEAQYLEMLRAASEAVKRADPTAKVTNSGYAGIKVKTVDALRSHTYADGKRPLDFVDILNVHVYTGRVPPELATEDFNAGAVGDTTIEADLRRLVAWRNRTKPGMPIWLSETGYDSAGPYGTDERTQAARLPRVVMLALANGMDKVFVYRESGSTASMHAASGVLRDDGTLKPSFLTYATLIRELDGVKGGAVRLPYPDTNVRLYLWRRGSERLLTAWAIEGAAKLALDLGQATVTDAFGHRRQMSLKQGLSLTDYPVYISGLSDLRTVDALLAMLKQNEAAEARRRAVLAGAKAYLFKFGGPAEWVTLDLGRERNYTPVLSGDVYSEAKGFGFWPGPADETQDRKWIRSDLDRVAVKLLKGHEFRWLAAAGRYTLRLGVGPYEDCRLTIKGAAGGDKVVAAPKGDVVVETALETAGGVLSLSLDNYSTLRWLTLVERTGQSTP